jgi:hypothetical protein
MSSSESICSGPHKDAFTRKLMVGFVLWDDDQEEGFRATRKDKSNHRRKASTLPTCSFPSGCFFSLLVISHSFNSLFLLNHHGIRTKLQL